MRKNLDETVSADIKMMRPVSIGNGYILYNRGEYTDFNNYDCDIVASEIT